MQTFHSFTKHRKCFFFYKHAFFFFTYRKYAMFSFFNKRIHFFFLPIRNYANLYFAYNNILFHVGTEIIDGVSSVKI